MKMLSAITITFILILSLLVASCGKPKIVDNNPYEDVPAINQTADVPPGAAEIPSDRAPQMYRVYIRDFGFAPQELTIHVGDTVKWLNMENFRHTVTFDEFGSESLLRNKQWNHTFVKTGTYVYSDPDPRYSPMNGTIIVQP